MGEPGQGIGTAVRQIRDSDVRRSKGGGGQQGKVDIAADRHLAAGGACRHPGNAVLVAAPVDYARGEERSRDQEGRYAAGDRRDTLAARRDRPELRPVRLSAHSSFSAAAPSAAPAPRRSGEKPVTQ